jgi:hypothetical protein
VAVDGVIFTVIVCLEAILFFIWLLFKITGIINRHKILFSILIIGILYLMISGHPSYIVNTNNQKNNNLADTVHAIEGFTHYGITNNGVTKSGITKSGITNSNVTKNGITKNYFDSGSAAELQATLYPGEDCPETGADGHRITLHNNISAINPTYRQMADFLKSDQTDKIPQNYSKFECNDFAERVYNNAEAAGYRCAWVKINFNYCDTAYACNAFNTVDNGLVFIDCTNYGKPDNDKIVDLKVGKKYRPESIGDFRYTYFSKGIVKNYQIYW